VEAVGGTYIFGGSIPGAVWLEVEEQTLEEGEGGV